MSPFFESSSVLNKDAIGAQAGIDALQDSADRVSRWVEKHDYRAHDPGDGLSIGCVPCHGLRRRRDLAAQRSAVQQELDNHDSAVVERYRRKCGAE
jgi:hypothetical protein